MHKEDRFARQHMLPDIGEHGQERLARACYRPSQALSPWAAKLSARYASASGWGAIGDVKPQQAHPLAAHFRHPAAADVGLAAIDVLAQSLPHFKLEPSKD